MCAPRSVGAIDPDGMTNASTTNARKMNARMNATRIDSTVSLALPSSYVVARAGAAVAGGVAGAANAEVGAAAGVSVIGADRSETVRQRVVARGSHWRCRASSATPSARLLKDPPQPVADPLELFRRERLVGAGPDDAMDAVGADDDDQRVI